MCGAYHQARGESGGLSTSCTSHRPLISNMTSRPPPASPFYPFVGFISTCSNCKGHKSWELSHTGRGHSDVYDTTPHTHRPETALQLGFHVGYDYSTPVPEKWLFPKVCAAREQISAAPWSLTWFKMLSHVWWLNPHKSKRHKRKWGKCLSWHPAWTRVAMSLERNENGDVCEMPTSLYFPSSPVNLQ